MKVLWVALGLCLAASVVQARGLEYQPRLDRDKLSQGATVLLDFRTDWCIACARHGSIIDTLKEQNPALRAAITYIVVDYDTYGESGMAEKRRVTQNGTLLLLRGSRELGRVEGAVMNDSAIKELLELSLD